MRKLYKQVVIIICLFCFGNNIMHSQEWMKSLEIAKKLALTQNKLLFVMWEDAIQYELPVIIHNKKGDVGYVEDLLLSEEINKMIWEYFVPVLINESAFNDMYDSIKDERSYGYLQLFRDDGIKIMDVNGNILNTAFINYNYFDFTKFVSKYALNTSYLGQEYRIYRQNKDFFSTFFLASRYVDYASLSPRGIRPELIELSNIYFDEAEQFLETYTDGDREELITRTKMARISQNIILRKPDKVVRQLNRINKDRLSESNSQYMAFLYFTAYKIGGDLENLNKWKTKVSSVNLKKADTIFRNLLK
ncbi:MAG: hypothetical protein AAGH46_01825 [Bacteroidota bacterium]